MDPKLVGYGEKCKSSSIMQQAQTEETFDEIKLIGYTS